MKQKLIIDVDKCDHNFNGEASIFLDCEHRHCKICGKECDNWISKTDSNFLWDTYAVCMDCNNGVEVKWKC